MSPKILIVDDVAFVRKTLAEIFRQAKYEIVGEAASGSEAIEMYARTRPDLVTMDIVMPQMSGLESIRQILKQDKNARIVIITAMDQENLVMEAINVGARDYLLKPFKAQEVIRTAERVLSGREGSPAARLQTATRS